MIKRRVQTLTTPDTATSRHKKPQGNSILAGILLFIAGGLILGGLYWVHLQQMEFARIGQISMGTVIELIESRDSDGDRTYAPRIEFLAMPGERLHTFKSSSSSNPPAYAVGQRVEILYNPENPQEVVIAADNSIATNLTMQIFAAVGAVLMALGVGILFFRIRSFFIHRPRQEALSL